MFFIRVVLVPLFFVHVMIKGNILIGPFMCFLMNSGSSKTHPGFGSWANISRKYRPAGSRGFQYFFDLDGGHSGFILHKKSRRKGRLRMFLDSNDNGRFDQKGQSLVGGVLKKRSSLSSLDHC